MDADLDTLATALSARTDDLLKCQPERVPAADCRVDLRHPQRPTRPEPVNLFGAVEPSYL